ncbi:MAG: COP23 domain-containing protein [Cyanobacteria bacterium J06641_5]
MAGPLGLPALTQAQAEDAVAGCVRELIDYGVTPNVAAEACTQQQSGTLRPSSPSIQKSPSVPKVPRPSNQPATAVAQPTPPPTTTTEPTTDPSALAFSCQSWEGQPTTMVRTQRGLLPLIVWKSAYFSNSGFTPESRCEIVSSRFQHHAERDNLRFISHGKLNAQKVLCVADRQALSSNSHNYECQAPLSGSLLLTLEATDDPETVLSELFAVASRANWGAVVFRGGNRFGVDLEEVLESREPISANLE